MPVFQLCALYIIFFILWFSLDIDNLHTPRIWLRFISGIYPIMNVCISILYQLCYKSKLLYFCFHFNAITTGVIINNLFWPPIFQDIITNHDSGCISLFSNFLKPNFIGTVTESRKYMLPSPISCEWTWHCVYPIRPCPGFSTIFRMKYFMSRYMYSFSISWNTWI